MKKRIRGRSVRIETERFGARVVAEIAKEAFIRGLTPDALAALASTDVRKVMAFMLDPQNASVGMIARLSVAMGLHFTMHAVPMSPKPAAAEVQK